jgi:hypothetical protein
MRRVPPWVPGCRSLSTKRHDRDPKTHFAFYRASASRVLNMRAWRTLRAVAALYQYELHRLSGGDNAHEARERLFSMELREAVAAETFQLLERPFRKFCV